MFEQRPGESIALSPVTQEASELRGQRARVIRWNQPSVDAVGQDFRNATDRRGDDRTAKGSGLEENNAERLLPRRQA